MSMSVSEDLFEKLRGKFPNLALGRDDGVKTLQPQEAKFFEFQYKNKDAIMGSVVVSLVDEGALKVYFNERMLDEADQETHDGWYAMLKGLSKFATQHMLNFETKNITKHRLNKNDYEYLKNRNKSQEELTMENKLYGTSNKSYQDVNGAKLIVQHKTSIDEEKMGARSRNIRAIYIENAQGERFRFSNNYLPGARAMARHIGNGGYPNDPFGEHIEEVMTEMNELRQFVRTVRATNYINEEAQDIIETATGRYHGLKDTLKSLTSQRGYVNYFENYEPTDVEIDEESIDALKEKLTREVYDDRLDSVLPTVGRAIKRRDDKQLAEDDGLKAIGMSSDPLKIYPNPEKDAEMDVYLKFIKRSDLSQERKNKALLVNITRMLSDRIVDDAASVALSRLDLNDKSDMALAYKLALKFIRGEVDVIEPKAKKDLYGKDHVAKEDTFEEFEAQLDDITATVDEGKMSDINIEMHEEVLYMAEDDFVEKYRGYSTEKHIRDFWKSAHDEFTEPMEGFDVANIEPEAAAVDKKTKKKTRAERQRDIKHRDPSEFRKSWWARKWGGSGKSQNEYDQEQQKILDGLKGAFKLMNQRNISRDELDEAEKNIRTSSKVIFDLKDKVIKRKVIIGFVEEQLTNLLGGEDKDTQDWRKFFKKRPSKALVKNCAIQAITSSDQGDAQEIMVELIRREQAIQPITQAAGGRYSVKKMVKPVNFYYHSPDARKVCIVGDFNDWKPDAHPMKRRTGGFWNAQISLPHGHHRYHFLVDGSVALDPRANGEVLNDKKERVSLIAVS